MESGSEVQPDDPGSGAYLLALGTAAVAASGAFLALDGIPVHVAGYALASVLAFTCVALFRRRALERLLALGSSTSRVLTSCALVVLVSGLACSVAHAWFLARHV